MSLEALTEFLTEASRNPVWLEVLRKSWGVGPHENGRRLVESYHRTLHVGDLLAMYRTMYASRKLDDRELMLQKQGQAWFTISGAGKEAVLAAAGLALRPTDPIWGYYRDRALVLQRGVTIREMLLQAVGAAEDPSSGGRQMAAHYGHRDRAVVSQASPTGAQVIPAVGLAEAVARTSKQLGQGTFPADAVVYTSLGDGTTAEGEVYESFRAAINYNAPLLIHLEDDGWGISVPVHEQVPGGDLLELFRGWPGLRIMEVDGLSVRASYDAFVEAAAHARARRGPVLLRSRVLRLYSHSSTDDMKKYRPHHEIEIEREERDPVARYAKELVAYGIATPEELLAVNREVDEEIRRVTDEVIRLPKPDSGKIASRIYQYEPARSKSAYADATRGKTSPHAGQALTLAESINRALDELMDLNPRIVMWGEDIADLSREMLARRPDLEGKGGVFGITKGLQRKYGYDRVFNSPICEASIIGRATGYAIQGFLPIVEVQFRDYLNPAWQQLMDQAATMSWRSNGGWNCPMVIRMSYGGYLGGAGAIWHSEAAGGAIIHYPGVRVCVPSNSEDAVGLLRAAVFSDDIVCYLEPKAIYRRKDEFLDRKYPGYDFVLWPGTARVYGDGKDLALVTYGNLTTKCFAAMKQLEKEGIKARMVDNPWLNPIDEGAIRTAADACGRVLVVDEDRRTCGAGAALADVIYRDRSLRRKVEVERIAALDCRVSYGPVGENAVLPQVDDILSAARSLCRGA